MKPSRTRRPQVDSSQDEIPVYLKLTKTVAWKVNPTETVKNLKALLHDDEIVSENIQNLFFAGKLLKDSESLADHGIQRNSTLHLVIGNSDGMRLLIKIPSHQRTVVVEARAHDTIRSVKSLIKVTEGIESDQFSLIYEGKLLEEDRTLLSLDVKNDSTISVVFCRKDVLSIYVKALTGKIAKLEVKVTFSVADVKAIAESILGVSEGSLFYSGQELEDSKIMACYDIKEGSMLEMLHIFQIFVKPGSGTTITLDVKQITTIQDLKDEIFKKTKTPVHLQSISFAGKQLEGERDLASYSIQKDCTLFMLLGPLTKIINMKVSEISRSITHLSTVSTVKELIGSKEGSVVTAVLFQGKALKDKFSLKHYGIKMDSIVDVFF